MFHQILEHLKATKTYKNRKLIKSGSTGEEYVVSIRISDGRWACACKHWIFRCNKDGSDCKHIEEIRRTYGNQATAATIIADLATANVEILKTKSLEKALEVWKAIKDKAEVMEFYLENTEQPPERVTGYKRLISEIRDKINALAVA